MPTLRQEDAQFLLSFLLPQLKSEQAVTAKIIAAVPPEATHYKPHPKSMTAFELSRHIAICELWFLDAICNGQFAENAARPPESATTCPDLAAWYTQNFLKRIPLLEALPATSLTKEIDYIGLRNDPAVAYLNISIRHSVHHRGQLSIYLRNCNAPVPAIYVESADEPYPLEDGTLPDTPPPAF